MIHDIRKILLAGFGAALLLGLVARAAADEVNYYLPPMAAPPSVIVTPGGDVIVPQVIITGDPVIYDSRFEESRWERQQRRDFHPDYRSWSDYYESPPWHHIDENDFNPWWSY